MTTLRRIVIIYRSAQPPPLLIHPRSTFPLNLSLLSCCLQACSLLCRNMWASLSQMPTHQRQHTHTHLWIYCICIKQNRKPLRHGGPHTHTHACGPAGRVCARSCHWCSLNKSTSLPLELSAIADLNLHSAASSFWVAVAALTKQVHFCFSGTKSGASAERARTIWMHAAQGFYRNGTRVESPCQHSLTSEPCYRTGGWAYIIIATVNDFFIFSPPCLWCCWVKLICRTLYFSFPL